MWLLLNQNFSFLSNFHYIQLHKINNNKNFSIHHTLNDDGHDDDDVHDGGHDVHGDHDDDRDVHGDDDRDDGHDDGHGDDHDVRDDRDDGRGDHGDHDDDALTLLPLELVCLRPSGEKRPKQRGKRWQ
ncbi:hypothetical protein CDAR_460531 [Caerostris darwini]|uniref:Uncharacterized protein n=1 Tax=Caerostris darwini TaxID=1538125 RepID=A0AAV4PQ93_9ARAC|nr:hypothetical protein CDAR_460531 [Caerostris darwini]